MLSIQRIRAKVIINKKIVWNWCWLNFPSWHIHHEPLFAINKIMKIDRFFFARGTEVYLHVLSFIDEKTSILPLVLQETILLVVYTSFQVQSELLSFLHHYHTDKLRNWTNKAGYSLFEKVCLIHFIILLRILYRLPCRC